MKDTNLSGRFSLAPVCAGVLCAALLVTGCLTPYEQGRRALDQGDLEAAQDYAGEALNASDQKDPRAYVLLARIYVEREEYNKAETAAQKAFKHDKTRADAGRILGKVYWETGQPVQAAQTWGAAREVDADIVSDEDYKKALTVGIDESRRTHSFEEALDLQEQLAELDSDHRLASESERLQTRKSLAAALVQTGKLEEAAELYATLAEETDEPPLWYELGILRVRLDKLQLARQALNRFVNDDDAKTEAERARQVASDAAEYGEHDLAVDFYLRSRKHLKSPTFERAKLERALAESLFTLGRRDTARQYLNNYLDTMRALRGRPLDADVYLTAADTAVEHDQSTLAAEFLETALQRAPPDWTVTRRLAQYHAVAVRDDEVRRVLETFVKRSSDTVDSLTRCARWARDRNNYSLAREFLRRAIDASDSDPDLRLILARTLDKQGDVQQLKETLDAFVDKFPDRRHSLLEVASLYAKHKLYADAEAVLKRVRDQSPKSLVIVDRLADLYREWGKPDRIETAYRRWLEARGESASDYRLVGERFARHDVSDLALEYLSKAANLGETKAWLQVADLYKRQQRDAKMRGALERYLAAKNRSPNALRAVLNRLEETSLHEFQVDVLQELIESEPSTREYYERLASVRLRQGNRTAAFEVWRRYVDRVGRSVEELERIGQWFQSNGNAELALPFYRQWLDEIDDPRLYRLLGEAYLSTGRRDTLRRVMNPESNAQNQAYARRYFEKYLAAGEFDGIELLEFAGMLRDNAMWQPAARAYGRALRDASPSDAAQLEHALTLLNLGHAGRALKIQKAYYDDRGESTEAAERIADQLIKAHLFRSALPYLQRLMESEVASLREMSFARQLEAFVHLGRHEDIDPMVETYISNASNPAKARQRAVQTLARRGLVRRAARQVERTRELQGDVMGLKLGSLYLRLGNQEKAWEQFDNYARNHTFGTEAWLEIAKAYRRRAMPDDARKALDRAVKTSSDGYKAFLQRAVFALRNGEFDRARADYQTAVERSVGDATEDVHKEYIVALNDVGQFRRAREIANRVRSSATSHQAFFAKQYFDDALQLATKERAQRLVDELERSSLDLSATVSLLSRHGFIDEAVDLVDREFQNGNLATAGRVLASYPSTITSVGGRDLLARLARPLLRSTSLKRPIRARLGGYMIRQGDYQRGIRYLSAAQSGRPIFWPMLVQAHANRGEVGRAIDLVREYESDGLDTATGASLWEQGALRLGLSGHHEEFVRQIGLSHLGPEASPTLIALQIEQILSRGSPSVAIERIQRMSNAAFTEGYVAGPQVQRQVEQLTAALATLAQHGFVEEASTLIDHVDGDILEHPTFRSFVIRFDARYRPAHLDTSLAADLESPVAAEKLLDRAETVMLARRFKRAEDLLTRLPDKMTPAYDDRATRVRRLLEHLRDADHSVESPAVDPESSEDLLGARRSAYRTDHHLGWDTSAYQHISAAFKQAPTQTAASRLLAAAEASGNREHAKEAVDAYFQHAEGPMEYVSGNLMRKARRLEPATLEQEFARIGAIRSASFQLRLAQTLVDFRTGDAESGRKRLTNYLESVDYGPIATSRVVEFLEREELHSEIRHIVRTALQKNSRTDGASAGAGETEESGAEQPRAVTRQTLMKAALASASLGFEEEFKSWSERALVGAPAEATLAQRAAIIACRRHQATACRRLAERTTDLAPERPPGWFALGVADILDGHTKKGRSHLQRGLRGGVDRFFALEVAGRAALKAGADQLAGDLLEDLLRTPNPAQMGPVQPLQQAVMAYNKESASKQGVEMIEERYPNLATTRGPAGRRAARVLTALYQGAEQHEKAFVMYKDSLADVWLQPDSSHGAIAVLQNNLAYAYATAGEHLDEAGTRVGLALGFARRRTSSYLDTRGWIFYKQGRLDAAERDVRSSIRTADSDAALGELYGHLSDILRSRGRLDQAFWLGRFADPYR